MSEEFLVVGCLAVGVALLFVAIVQTTSEWPTRLGRWGVLLFGGLGIALLAESVRARTTVRRDTEGATTADTPLRKDA